jgi:hypothetical protein
VAIFTHRAEVRPRVAAFVRRAMGTAGAGAAAEDV